MTPTPESQFYANLHGTPRPIFRTKPTLGPGTVINYHPSLPSASTSSEIVLTSPLGGGSTAGATATGYVPILRVSTANQGARHMYGNKTECGCTADQKCKRCAGQTTGNQGPGSSWLGISIGKCQVEQTSQNQAKTQNQDSVRIAHIQQGVNRERTQQTHKNNHSHG